MPWTVKGDFLISECTSGDSRMFIYYPEMFHFLSKKDFLPMVREPAAKIIFWSNPFKDMYNILLATFPVRYITVDISVYAWAEVPLLKRKKGQMGVFCQALPNLEPTPLPTCFTNLLISHESGEVSSLYSAFGEGKSILRLCVRREVLLFGLNFTEVSYLILGMQTSCCLYF